MKVYPLVQVKYFTLILSLLALTGCASIFATKMQKVEIIKENDATLLVDGKIPIRKKRKYLLNNKRAAIQLTAQKEGYKDENIVAGTYRNHPLKYVTLVTSLPFLCIPMALEKGPKSILFEKKITVGTNLVKLPVKSDNDKEIKMNKVSANIKSEDYKQRFFWGFRSYHRRSEKRKSKSSEKVEDIEVENTVFIDLFNSMLKRSGFIDTTNKVLKDSYVNNLLMNATIKGLTFHQVSISKMVYADIIIDWEVLDFYKNSIYTTSTETSSGQFTIEENTETKKRAFQTYANYEKRFKTQVERVIEDAMEYGLIELLSQPKVSSLLKDNSEIKAEESLSFINIPTSAKYVSSPGEAINSGITIKGREGHGSGFIISPEGHIITNYHVLSGQKDLKVVLNNREEYDFEIIRESKIHDLALIKINAKGLTPFKISKNKDVEIGKTVYAVGSPTSTSLSQSISKGIISGFRDNDNRAKLIQTDVSVNSGNSGGALIDKEGCIIGVVSAKLMGVGVEGVGFAIPAYEIYDRLNLK